MHPLLKATRFTRGHQPSPPPIAHVNWDYLEIPDSWNYLAMLPSWSWWRISLDGYPNWDIIEGPHLEPPFILLEITRGTSPESDEIARFVDNIATGLFYYRDWTSDGIPFVNPGDTYWSGFWFQNAKDAINFYIKFGGAASWEPNFEKMRQDMNAKRNDRF